MANDRLDWYREARFGLFVHWGPYSVAGVEASWPIMAPDLAAILFGAHAPISEAEYTALPQRFNPVDFDACEWVRLAKQAGMRYIVITAKHHDGFCMFDAPGTDYKITNTPFGRDICAELAAACADAGMKLGFYYSPPDIHHPGYRDTSKPASANWLGEPKRKEWGGYLDYMEDHLRYLLTGYGQVSLLWWDALFNYDHYDPPRFQNLVRQLSPDTLVNDRLGAPYDYITPEQFVPRAGIPVRSDSAVSSAGMERFTRLVLFLLKVPGIRTLLHRAGQRTVEGGGLVPKIPIALHPTPDQFQPWETCMTMNRTWAYNPTDTDWKPPHQLIRNMVKVASRGGNYLLNVGPTPQGTFPLEAVERLVAIGDWMARNDKAIHGTAYGPHQGLPRVRSTEKDGTVYLHILDWPDEGQIILTGFKEPISTVSLLATGESLPFQHLGGSLAIEVPREAPDPSVSVLALRTGDTGH